VCNTYNYNKWNLDAKRLIGRKFDDPTVQADMKHWPFKVIQGEGARPKIQVEVKGEAKTFFPEVKFLIYLSIL
jgi:molecular chaperone DnaK (HSP70)